MPPVNSSLPLSPLGRSFPPPIISSSLTPVPIQLLTVFKKVESKVTLWLIPFKMYLKECEDKLLNQ